MCQQLKYSAVLRWNPWSILAEKIHEMKQVAHKKAEMISSTRLSNTSNAFIIYYFYNQVEKVMFITQ